jgi:hypothetical protein
MREDHFQGRRQIHSIAWPCRGNEREKAAISQVANTLGHPKASFGTLTSGTGQLFCLSGLAAAGEHPVLDRMNGIL